MVRNTNETFPRSSAPNSLENAGWKGNPRQCERKEGGMSCRGAMRRESVGRSWLRRYQSTSGFKAPLELRISATVKACEPSEEEEEEDDEVVVG